MSEPAYECRSDDCDTVWGSKRARYCHEAKAHPGEEMAQYHDEEWLREKYHEEKLSAREIGRLVGVTGRTILDNLHKHGIEVRPEGRHRNNQAKCRTNHRGYETVQVRRTNSVPYHVRVHRLAAVAWHGYDAIKGKVVHHKNGIPWDNREENIEVWDRSDHSKHHYDNGDFKIGEYMDT